MPKTPTTWPTLLSRIESIYASGREPFDQLVSDFNNGQVVRFFEDEAFPRLRQWMIQAWALAERDGPKKIRDVIWERVQNYTGKTLAELDEVDLWTFEYPLAQRNWNQKDPTDAEGYYDHTDVRALAQLFIQEMIAHARLAANVTVAPAASAAESDLVTPDYIAGIEGITPQRVRQRISEYKTTHGRLPTYAVLPPGKKRGVLIRLSVYSRQ